MKKMIQDHEDWPGVIDNIEAYGNYSKRELVDAIYDESGLGESKAYLRSLSRGTLLANLIDGLYGGTCQ